LLVALNVGLVAFAIVAAVSAVFGAEWLLSAGEWVPAAGLVFPPRQRITYRTPEFAYEVETNSLGFRDREFSTTRSSASRIVALGDSFTYGWGVAAGESWPKRLEENLGSTSVEIANLGVPGAGPADYAHIAQRAIAVLQPDMVVVGVLQGDDLAQLAEYDSTKCALHPEESWRSYLRHKFPNLSQLIKPREAPGRLTSVTTEWQHQVKTILDRASEQDRKRFEGLDTRLRNAFRRGELNPPVLAASFGHPSYFMETMVPGPRRQLLIDNMASCLTKIKRLAEVRGAEVVVVAVPFGAYVAKRNFEIRRKLGFQLDESALTSGEMDEAIRLAASQAGLVFISVTAQFRATRPEPPLFFEFDGHLTAQGHRLLADSIVGAIRERLRARPGRSN
jgi:lysophospholipase L1-like esterase